jgi:hypothetical protein
MIVAYYRLDTCTTYLAPMSLLDNTQQVVLALNDVVQLFSH